MTQVMSTEDIESYPRGNCNSPQPQSAQSLYSGSGRDDRERNERHNALLRQSDQSFSFERNTKERAAYANYNSLSPQSARSPTLPSEIGEKEPNAMSHDLPLGVPKTPSSENTNPWDIPEDDSMRPKWFPDCVWRWLPVICFLIQAGVAIYAACLNHQPYLFQIRNNPFLECLTMPTYSFVITFTGGVLSAINALFWTQLGAVHIVRICQSRINCRFYGHCVRWARSSSNCQLFISLIASLAISSIVGTYVAAFTAAFGLDVVSNSYNISAPLTNISSNADALIANHAVLPYGVSENDFDLNLVELSLQFRSQYFPNQIAPFLIVDGVQVQGMGGMVLGVGAATTVRDNDLSTAVGSKVASILSSNYGTNKLQFTAAGVLAATGCTTVIQNLTATGQLYNDLDTVFTISTPSCGEVSRTHAGNFDRVHDAYSCLVGPTIVTGIITTNPSSAMLVEATECSTTLSDALGSGTYMESTNEFTLDPGQTFESTPMTPPGVLSVFEIIDAGWIQAIGYGGSQGLQAFIDQRPLNDSRMTSKMEEAISYLYAVGGAKIVNNANVAIASRGASAPYVYLNTTLKIDSWMFQIGYGRKGAHEWFITFLALNALLTWMVVNGMIRYTHISGNLAESLPVMSLALKSPQVGLLNGTSVGRLPDAPLWERVKGWFMGKCCGTCRARTQAEQTMAYCGHNNARQGTILPVVSTTQHCS